MSVGSPSPPPNVPTSQQWFLHPSFSDQNSLQVFYNRIPKTGSEAIIGISMSLATQNNFTYIQSMKFNHFGGHSVS